MENIIIVALNLKRQIKFKSIFYKRPPFSPQASWGFSSPDRARWGALLSPSSWARRPRGRRTDARRTLAMRGTSRQRPRVPTQSTHTQYSPTETGREREREVRELAGGRRQQQGVLQRVLLAHLVGHFRSWYHRAADRKWISPHRSAAPHTPTSSGHGRPWHTELQFWPAVPRSSTCR